jgi:hypothetical protein
MKFLDDAVSLAFAILALNSIWRNGEFAEYGLLLVLSVLFRIAAKS